MEFSAERKKNNQKNKHLSCLFFSACLPLSVVSSPRSPVRLSITVTSSSLSRTHLAAILPLMAPDSAVPVSHLSQKDFFPPLALGSFTCLSHHRPPRHVLRSPRYSFKHLRHGSRSHARTHMRELEVVVARFLLLLLPLFVLLTYHRVSRLSSAAPFSPQPAAAGSRGAGQVNHTLRRKTHAPPAKGIRSGDPFIVSLKPGLNCDGDPLKTHNDDAEGKQHEGSFPCSLASVL